ncbi:MAG TPA: cupin domain-containing protein [Thermodesulfobacteriota bacterium]|nr:cupin domain-containing protein [Thermodesulfobacteriota bacterium]
MKFYRKGTGEKYTPFDHFGMATQVIFNPDGGCNKANVTLSTLPKGAGSNDEVHEKSDQIFYMLRGTMTVSAKGRVLAKVSEGDGVFVEAGDVHSVRNDGDVPAVYLAVTVPPLDKTH